MKDLALCVYAVLIYIIYVCFILLKYNPYQSNYPPANPYGGGYTSYGYGGGYGNPFQQNPAFQMVRKYI